MLTQETYLDWREHTRLRHKRLSQNTVQLPNARDDNSLLATFIAPRQLDTVQLYVWQTTNRVPTDRIVFRHDLAAAIIANHCLNLHAVTTRIRVSDVNANTTQMRCVSLGIAILR